MTKKIETLVEDIYEVIKTRGGWDATITEFIREGVGDVFKHRLEDEAEERTGALRMSSMGKPCKRQLWYMHHTPSTGEGLPAPTILKFLYGDMVELLVLSLALAAGHDVRGMQDELEIGGIKGHRDAVIDGVTIDVKSASPFSFSKFKYGLKKDEDGFGYLSQLRSYVAAGSAMDSSIEQLRGGFLVVDKVSGEICLDLHVFVDADIETLGREFEETKAIVESETPPDRPFEAVKDGYKNKDKKFVSNGNEYLGFQCSYCEFKKECWPGLRTFMYKSQNGYRPKHYTKIVKEPKVNEVK